LHRINPVGIGPATAWAEVKKRLRGAFPENALLSARTLREAKRRSRLYVIFLTPRSGSTWLTELMAGAGGLGVPQEWFHEEFVYSSEPALGCLPPSMRGTLDINDYLLSIVDEGQGVAGAEISIFQALMLSELLEGPLDPGLLDVTLFLRRIDVVAQGISLYRSVQSGRFHSYQAAPDQIRSFSEVSYQEEEILYWIAQILEYEDKFEQLFERCGFDPIPIFYEDLQCDPMGLLVELAAFLGAPCPATLPQTSLTLMRDQRSAEWAEAIERSLPDDFRIQIDNRRHRLETIRLGTARRHAA